MGKFEFNENEMITKYEQLNKKVQDKTANKEEYKDYELYSRIKENLPKIKNLQEYKEKLEKEVQEIQNEISTRENVEEMNSKSLELEVQLNALMQEKEELKEELKRPNLEDKTRQNLETRIKDLDGKIALNHREFSNTQKELESHTNESKVNRQELDELKMEKCQKLSKCKMAIINLQKGRSWDYIEIKLDNWKDRRFTSKTDITNNVRPITEKEKETKIEENIEEVDLVLIKETKYPRLQKIKEWFKDKFNKVKSAIKREKQEEQEEKQEINEKTQQNDFKEELRKIAEQGMNCQRTISEETIKRLNENKETSYKEAAEKYGDKNGRYEEGR